MVLSLSLSLSLFPGRQKLLLHSFSPSLKLALVCADYKKLVYASWLLHALAFISGHPSLFFLSLSPFLSPSTGTIYKGEMNVVTSLLETIREHDLSRHVGSE